MKKGSIDLKNGKLTKEIIKQIEVDTYFEKIDDSEIVEAIKTLLGKIKNGKLKGEYIIKEEKRLPHGPFRKYIL